MVIKSEKNHPSLMSRTDVIFENGLNSIESVERYRSQINGFCRFAKIIFDELQHVPSKQLQILVEDYIISKRDHLSHGTLRGFINSIKYYIEIFDMESLNYRKIKRFLPDQQKILGSQAYTTDDVKHILENTKNKRLKAMFLLMACSGVRVGSMTEMKLKHLEEMPLCCKSLLVYPNTKDEYTTFITPESYEAVQKHFDERISLGEIITPESYLFVNKKGGQVGLKSIRTHLSRYVRDNLKREKESDNRYSKMSNHAFRKRFNTILKLNQDCNINLAEKLMGHSLVKLDTHYFNPTKEQLFAEYEKNLNELLIDDKYKLAIELESKKDEILQLEDKDQKIERLESQMKELLAHFTKMA